jgi:hypothetical protein
VGAEDFVGQVGDGAHLSGVDGSGLLDVGWWRRQGRGDNWAGELDTEALEATAALRRCTYAGRL